MYHSSLRAQPQLGQPRGAEPGKEPPDLCNTSPLPVGTCNCPLSEVMEPDSTAEQDIHNEYLSFVSVRDDC
ncbi:hypothetical protein SKAU_G00359590 [Synaphobranchus kaupii]|uniref:Uncharacterized protein n=1 Tax=Synaphobranchus kaupii TaxID=118154 RepID=A0A9Q1EI22_SYNKA|nr:hypothetical protein SKAU_G00359590 [Synaphobranchus kaupii]